MQLVNLRLMSHPINWVFVWIVLALASMAWKQIHDHYQGLATMNPNTNQL